MSSLPSTHERARLRKSLIQLATLLVLTLLASGLVSLFALWSMDRLQTRTAAAEEQLIAAVNNARTAQVSFKIQVQSWKNLLLRGNNVDDYDIAKREFLLSEAETDHALELVAEWATRTRDPELKRRVDGVLAEHRRVGSAYRSAMPASGTVMAQRNMSDEAVRGIDRTLNASLDDLVRDMLAHDQVATQDSRRQESERFALLSRVIWIAIATALLLVSALLWRTLRDPALRA